MGRDGRGWKPLLRVEADKSPCRNTTHGRRGRPPPSMKTFSIGP